ncbi:MAG: hypothetical protein IJ409_06130 [Lachnospiraceae bacterium]|nr:hypothetical protein [Lachnospiraceae bacterium]
MLFDIAFDAELLACFLILYERLGKKSTGRKEYVKILVNNIEKLVNNMEKEK